MPGKAASTMMHSKWLRRVLRATIPYDGSDGGRARLLQEAANELHGTQRLRFGRNGDGVRSLRYLCDPAL